MYQEFYFDSITTEAARYYRKKRKHADDNNEGIDAFSYKKKFVDPEISIKREVNALRRKLLAKYHKKNKKIRRAKNTTSL